MNQFKVKITVDGKEYHGTARVESRMVTVSSVNLGQKSASVSSNNQVLADLLLHELVDDQKRRERK